MKVDYNNRKIIKSFYSANQFVQSKDIRTLPREVIKDLKLISLGNPNIGYKMADAYGSFVNRIATFYGDIDAQQLVLNATSLEDLGNKVAREIQKTINRIVKKKDHFYSETKAGIDKRYYFEIAN